MHLLFWNLIKFILRFDQNDHTLHRSFPLLKTNWLCHFLIEDGVEWGDSRSVSRLPSLWISATIMQINNNHCPCVVCTFVLTHMYTHTHTPASPPDFSPPNCSSSQAPLNILHIPQMQETNLFRISQIWGKGQSKIRLNLNIHFIFYFLNVMKIE